MTMGTKDGDNALNYANEEVPDWYLRVEDFSYVVKIITAINGSVLYNKSR